MTPRSKDRAWASIVSRYWRDDRPARPRPHTTPHHNQETIGEDGWEWRSPTPNMHGIDSEEE